MGWFVKRSACSVYCKLIQGTRQRQLSGYPGTTFILSSTPHNLTSVAFIIWISIYFQTVKSREKSIWVLQDSNTNSYESVVVYAPVDINTTQLVLAGHDPSNIQILPSGFSIIPDGVESRPLVITSTQDDRNSQGGSLLTLALQTLINPSPAAKLNMESVESVTSLVSVTLHNIKRSLQIEDC